MIICENLSFDYPNLRALDNISFKIEPQSITALVGPNGAGKTTLLRTLAALDTPISGSYFIDEIEGLRFPRKIHKICSFLPDFFGLYDALTVKQCLTFTALSYHLKSSEISSLIEKTIRDVELTPHLNKKAGELSRGLRQRLAIAQAIIHNPKVLFLDEPASGLDPEARMHLSELLLSLRKSGMTIIVSSHILSELEDYSTHMMMIKNGKIVKHCAISEEANQAGPKILKLVFTELNDQILDKLKAFSNIKIHKVEELHVVIAFEGDANAQQKLLKELVVEDIPVCAIEELKLSMAEVYLKANQDEQK